MKYKPCPFCGLNDELSVEKINPYYMAPHYAVYCDNCGAVGPIERAEMNYEDRNQNRSEVTKRAINSWNMRGCNNEN